MNKKTTHKRVYKEDAQLLKMKYPNQSFPQIVMRLNSLDDGLQRAASLLNMNKKRKNGRNR